MRGIARTTGRTRPGSPSRRDDRCRTGLTPGADRLERECPNAESLAQEAPVQAVRRPENADAATAESTRVVRPDTSLRVIVVGWTADSGAFADPLDVVVCYANAHHIER